MVVHFGPSPQPFLVDDNVPIAVSHRLKKQSFELTHQGLS